MKRYLMLIPLLVLLPATGMSQISEREVLLNTLTRFLDSASYNDAEAHDSFWAEDLVYTSADGIRYTKDEIMRDVRAVGPRSISPDDPIYSVRDIDLRIYDDTAVMNFTLEESLDVGETVIGQYYNSCVLEKRDGRWKAVNWHSTEMEGSP